MVRPTAWGSVRDRWPNRLAALQRRRQRRGDPGLDPLGERPLGHAPRAPGGAISLFTCPCRGSIGHCATLPERLTARRPVLLAARMLARNKFLYSFSRPALRAAACGGRPRPAMGRRDRGTGRTVHEPSGAGSRLRCLRRSCSVPGNSGRVDPGRSRSPWLGGLEPLGCRTDSSRQGDAAASPSRSAWTRRPERAAAEASGATEGDDHGQHLRHGSYQDPG